MWTHAEIDQRPAAIDSGLGALRHLVADDAHLERVRGEELQRLLLGDDQALEGILLLADLVCFGFKLFKIFVHDRCRADVCIIVEPGLQRRPDG